jgi:hypothetical protein
MNDLRFFGFLIIVVAFGFTCESCNTNNKKDNETKSDSITSTVKSEIDYTQIGNQLLQTEKIGDLKIGLSNAKTIDLLGEPGDKTKSELWGADGEYHHTLIYNDKGIEIDIVGENEAQQKIGMITVTEPCSFKTTKNIGIGNSAESVKTAYSGLINPEFSDSKSIVAGSIYGGLIFKIEADKVKEIIVGAVAE